MRAGHAAGLAALAALANAARTIHCQKGLVSSLGRYSVCCPKPDTVLTPADRVFVLFGQGG